MLLDMAPGSKAPVSFKHRCRLTSALLLIVFITSTKSAPTTYDEVESKRTDLVDYFNDPTGCYYNYQHYEEGDRIVTNEPCLNCTCHNRMLMCYLRVCPFSKAIGQDCTVQKSPDQCCPVISCPEVPVQLLTSSTTQKPSTTTVGWHDNYGCMMNENGFFPDGAQVPSDPKKPCELCYCIRNRTACIIQECTLHVEGCRPVYQDGVCCPVRYDCDYESEKSTTSAPQISGGLVFATTSAPFDCRVNDAVYRDGESIEMVSEKPCEHCYCMRGDIVCAVQNCGEPLRGKDCSPEPIPAGQCCPTSYHCANETIDSYDVTTLQPASMSDTDENEAEKYPLHEDAYDKLGEHQPGQQDHINDDDSDNTYTTQANNNEISPVETIDQTTDKIADVSNDQNTVGNPNTSPTSDNINEENKQDVSNAKPELSDSITPPITGSQDTKLDTTGKPIELSTDEVQSTQSSVADPSSNENSVSSTVQTTSNDNNEIPSNNLSQGDITSNELVVTTDRPIESDTQNILNKIQEGTDVPAVAQNEPIKPSSDENKTDQPIVTKPQIESTHNVEQEPSKESNEESTENYIEENKIQTNVPFNEAIEQTTQKLNQQDAVKDPLKESNAQTDVSPNVEQDSSNQNNENNTEVPQIYNIQTDIPIKVEQDPLNINKPQDENISSSEIPKVDNQSTEQNKIPNQINSQTENQVQPENTPNEKNQDGNQQENVSSTETPQLNNESTEQYESSTGNNLPSADQNVQPIEIPVQNEPIKQNQDQDENLSPTTTISQIENEPIKQNQDQTENVSPTTTVPQIANEPVKQNLDQTENVSPTSTIPQIANEPVKQNQDQTENVSPTTTISQIANEPVKQNQDQTENVSPTTTISQIANEPVKQNQNQDENVSSAVNPQTENEPIEQNQNQDENVSPTVRPETDNKPVKQNQDQSENISPTVVSQTGNEPINQNQDQGESIYSTEPSKVENEPVVQNKPIENNNQSELEKISVSSNQDSSQSDNTTPTEIIKVDNESSEHIEPQTENNILTGNQSESDNKPLEPNQDGAQNENASPTTVIPSVGIETINQNKPANDSSSQTENQSESEKTPTEQNQNGSSGEHASQTEIQKVDNEDNKSPIENSTQSEKTTIEQGNQESSQVDNNSPTKVPSKLNEPQSENIAPEKPDSPFVPENGVSTDQPIEDNNIYIVSPTSTPLFSQNQIKDEKLPVDATSTSNVNDDKDVATAEINQDKINESGQSQSDEKPSSTQNDNKDNISSVSSTEKSTENNVPTKINDQNAEQSTETKPIENNGQNGVSNDVTSNPITSSPVNGEHNDNRFGSSSEPALTSTPETYVEVNTNPEVINQGVLVDDSTSQENQPLHEHSEEADSINAGSIEHHNDPEYQTETPTETEASTNEYSSSVDEHTNDVTTILPQQQLTDNNIPVQQELLNLNEPVKAPEDTKITDNLSDPNVPIKAPDSQIPIETNEGQNSDDNSKPTESPPDQNVYESVTSHDQLQGGNVNEMIEQTTIYQDGSNDKNNINVATDSNQNNDAIVTPSSENVETGTSEHDSSKEPIKNINENENTTISHVESTSQISQGISENSPSVEDVVTTINYIEQSSITPTTNAPSQAENIQDEKLNAPISPMLPSSNTQTTADESSPVNVQSENVGNEEVSTVYNVDDGSTNSPILRPSNVILDNNGDKSTTNNVNQGSNDDFESYTTLSPVEKVESAINSGMKPTNDDTTNADSNLPEQTNSSGINANDIVNEHSSQSPQNNDKPPVTETPDYTIHLTAISSTESTYIGTEPVQTEDQVNSGNDINTPNVDKNSDIVTTEINESAQPGVPGEGSCLIDFVTYAHKAEVPKSNPCHEKCECLNSIVTCTSVNCPPAPPQHRNCIPLHPGNESWCCPTYMCEGGIEGVLFESHNQLGSPQLISTVVLEDKPGENNDEKLPTDDEVSSTTSPQNPSEYNTIAPIQTDTSSNIITQDGINIVDVSTQTDIPNKQVDDSAVTDKENNIPVTTYYPETIENGKPTVNDQTADNEKPVDSVQSIENDKPINNVQPLENDKPIDSVQPIENDKPIKNEQTSENEKPVENEQPTESNKPVESNQTFDSGKPVEIDLPTENDKPIDETVVGGVTTEEYVADVQTTVANIPALNNIEEQNPTSNTGIESQDNAISSTELPNYPTTSSNAAIEQNQPEQNPELDSALSVTTYKPNDSVIEQQEDNKKPEDEASRPTINEESGTKPTADVVTDQPESNPLEITQTPTTIADEKPTLVENNVNGFRPSNIDEIISSVNMVKDAIKNSLETSSKPAEIEYLTTIGAIENYETTVLPEISVTPSSDSNQSNQESTENSEQVVPDIQTDGIDEKLPEAPTVTDPSDITGVTQLINHSPSINSDQGMSTESPLNIPEKQEIPNDPTISNADANVNQHEEITENKTPEITTQYLPSAVEQDLTSNKPDIPNDSIPQINSESSTSQPNELANDKTPEITTQILPSSEQQEVITNDAVNKPAEEEKPDAENPMLPSSDVNADKVPEVSTQITNAQSSTDSAGTSSTEYGNRFGESSSSSPPVKLVIQEDIKHPLISDSIIQKPFDTENSSLKPSSVTTSVPYTHKPSYTPIPQSTWTQKPFHQESTSEASQPDTSFPDEYDDENEAVFGPGTCRYGGKIYVSAQQVPRDDPCDFCFCFRGDIICLQQSCPPPIFGCFQENIQGFCCPRYECPVAQATSVNITTTTTTTTTTLPPHFFANAYRGAARRAGCLIHGHAYRVGEDVGIASGPCLECICGADGKMKCDPKSCSPEPLLRKMMAEAVDHRR